MVGGLDRSYISVVNSGLLIGQLAWEEAEHCGRLYRQSNRLFGIAKEMSWRNTCRP